MSGCIGPAKTNPNRMHRSLVTFSAVALLAAAVMTILYLRLGHAKELTDLQLADTLSQNEKLSAGLTTAKAQGDALQAKLTTTEAGLEASKAKLAATETRANQLDRDLGQAKSLLSLQEQNAHALTAEIASLKRDLADARSSSVSPEAVAGYKSTIAELERQLAAAGNGAAAPTAAGAATAVFTSRAGRATVVSVGPENAFVVLDFGASRGAQLGQSLSITHGTETVATALISDVRTNFSIAQVQPDSLHGVLQKGDLALLLR